MTSDSNKIWNLYEQANLLKEAPRVIDDATAAQANMSPVQRKQAEAAGQQRLTDARGRQVVRSAAAQGVIPPGTQYNSTAATPAATSAGNPRARESEARARIAASRSPAVPATTTATTTTSPSFFSKLGDLAGKAAANVMSINPITNNVGQELNKTKGSINAAPAAVTTPIADKFRDATGKVDTAAFARSEGRKPAATPTFADKIVADGTEAANNGMAQAGVSVPGKTFGKSSIPLRPGGAAPAPPTAPTRTTPPPSSGLANKPLAPKIAAQPAQSTQPTQADSNPPGTMLSRGLSRLKFKSPTTTQGYTGPTSAQLPSARPKSSIKPLFSKGGLFNR